MIVNPRCSETQFLGQLIEQFIKESPILVFAVDNQRRRLPLETFPDRFDWVEIRGTNRKEHQINPEFVSTLARVLAEAD